MVDCWRHGRRDARSGIRNGGAHGTHAAATAMGVEGKRVGNSLSGIHGNLVGL